VLEDFLSILDPLTGEERRRISILEAVEASDFSLLKEGSRNRSGDLYHTNTVSILEGSADYPLFAEGRVLLYLLGLGTMAVMDTDSGALVWASTGPETHRHDPQLLGSGRILIFNNFHEGPESSVTERDMSTGEVTWRYAGSPSDPLYSKTCGTAQRLENGNTLITESDNGRALEVDAQGQKVWEFVSPHRAGPEEAYIATLFELMRLPMEVSAWIADPEESTH
jgi:outer membrane protein assembly factor BamB